MELRKKRRTTQVSKSEEKDTTPVKKREITKYFDYSLVVIVIFLIGFGLVMLYSTSSYNALSEHNDSCYFLKRQATFSVLGLFVMFVVSFIPYQVWRRPSGVFFVISLITVFLVLTPLGISSHNARRWIGHGSIRIQPAEIVKVATILLIASLICKFGRRIKYIKSILFIGIIGFIGAVPLYIITDNLSSCIIVFGITVIMTFVAYPKYWPYILGVSAVAAVVIIYLYHLFTTYDINQLDDTVPFRIRRMLIWKNPESSSDNYGYQTLQALYAIGSGGFFGKGLGNSIQKLGFIPEAQNDMIFSIICEELGLFGAICVILLFIMMIWRFMIIANNAPDLFGAMIVVGVMSHVAIQVILNIAVVTNTIPNTGISLPFISYGGSSVVFLLIEIGLVLNVSRQISFEK